MKFLNFGKRKEEKNKEKEAKKVIGEANNIVKEAVLQKALEENQEKEKEILSLKNKNTDLENNLKVLIETIANIKEICNNSNGKVVSKNKILKELGD